MEFFARAKIAGADFAWAGASIVHEDVPPGRVRIGWVFRRSFRIGCTNAWVQRRWRYKRYARPLIFAKSMGRLAWAAVLVLRYPFNAGMRVEALSLVARSLGEMAWLLGLSYREYAPSTPASAQSDRPKSALA
jgi:succinoglycan biosynthesis protein ExoM